MPNAFCLQIFEMWLKQSWRNYLFIALHDCSRQNLDLGKKTFKIQRSLKYFDLTTLKKKIKQLQCIDDGASPLFFWMRLD